MDGSTVPNDLLITGLPRAGTTLVTAMVDALVQSVALSEPDSVVEVARATDDAECFARGVLDFHLGTRSELLDGDSVLDIRDPEGALVTDFIRHEAAATRVEKPVHAIDRPELEAGFLLASKHNALYTAVLEPLIALGFRLLAIVREPVELLRSWAEVPFPIARGRLPGAERYWPAVAEVAASRDGVQVRQAKILEAFVRRYRQLQRHVSLIRYESLAADPGLVGVMLGREARYEVPVRPRQKTPLPDRQRRELEALVRDLAPTAWEMYH